jgi:4-amino-4-deoxy-L-arabinose transferase-like glycosyltransferase
LKEIPWFKGFAVYLLIVAPWYVAILKKHGYQFFKDFIIFHNIHRFTSKVPGHPTEWWYYLANYFWLFLPFSFFFPFAVYRLWKEKLNITDEVLSFVTVWFFTVVIFFQIAHTKLAHYLLPSFPAFAVIVTWYVRKYKDKLPYLITTGIFLLLTATAVGFFVYKGWKPVGLIALLPAVFGALLSLRKKDYRFLLTSFLGTMVLFKWVTLPSLEDLRAKPAVGKEIREIAEKHPELSFFFLDYTSPEIVYYYRKGKLESVNPREAKELLSGDKPVVIVTRENRLKHLKETKYYLWDKKKELITKHSIVVISNVPEERLNGN